jgi:aldose 1-epimerase
MEVKVTDFGEINGQKVELFTITNDLGNSIAVTNYGATWVSATVPDSKGHKDDVLLGFSDLDGYLADTCYIGASVGRFANRIGGAQFVIDGKEYHVSANSGENCLHGGVEGLSFRVWNSRMEDDGVTFTVISPDGDQGFPGELRAKVRYHWDNDNRATVEFKAKTSRATPVSLTNHAYFNLRGEGDINSHVLKINAQKYLPMLAGGIVTGEQEPVDGTPFDFRTPKPIGQDIDAEHEQIAICRGYDESFLVKTSDDGELRTVAEVYEPETGRVLKVKTTYPTVHLYTANYLNSVRAGKKGKVYTEREAFCLEAQYAPNSPNLKSFPTCILRPDTKYRHVTEFHFKTK